MTEHRIMACTLDGLWLKGTVDDHIFWAKVCDEPSRFGIDNGRVIKLHVRKCEKDREGKVLFSYERGWDKRPRGKLKSVSQALVRFCESLPEQALWRRTFHERAHCFLVTDEDVLEYEQDNP